MLTDLEIIQASKEEKIFNRNHLKTSNSLVLISGVNVKNRSFKCPKVVKVDTEKLNVGGRGKKHYNFYSTHGYSGYSRSVGSLGQP